MWPMQGIVYFGEYFSLLSGDQRATCAMKASSRMLYMFFRRFSYARLISHLPRDIGFASHAG